MNSVLDPLMIEMKRYELKKRFDFITTLQQSVNYRHELTNAGFPILSSVDHCVKLLTELEQNTLELILVKAHWVLDHFASLRGLFYLENVDYEQDISQVPCGQLLYSCIDYFKISPAESLDVTWSHIFSVVAIDRLAELYHLAISASDEDKLYINTSPEHLILLYSDLLDCAAKAEVFNKLLDEGWAKSYYAKLRGKAKINKTAKLKEIVIKRYILEHRDADILSAANAIECQLLAEKCPELDNIKSSARRAKTFAEWISKHLLKAHFIEV